MDYDGVNADTIDNGRALNAAFIQFILANAGAGATDEQLSERLLALDPAERARLASGSSQRRWRFSGLSPGPTAMRRGSCTGYRLPGATRLRRCR